MAVKMLSDVRKRDVAVGYQRLNLTFAELAQRFECSVTTIKRVLEEAGAYKPVKKLVKFPPVTHSEVTKIMAICYEHKIDSQKLEMLINEPSLTPDNVVVFLRNSNQRQLAIILVAAGLATQLPTFPIPKDAQMRLIE